MKVEILNEHNYQCYIPRENMVEFSKEELAKIGNGYKFDLITKTIVVDTAYQENKIKQEKLDRISNLKYWFNNDYRMYVEMLTRREALNISDTIIDSYRNKTYTSLNDLYLEAEVVASEIKSLENQIN